MVNRLGIDRRNKHHEEYVGKYVEITPIGRSGASGFAGKLIRLEEGEANLNPYHTVRYDESGPVHMLVEDDTGDTFSMPVDFEIKQTTRKSLEAMCKFVNGQTAMGLEKARLDLEKAQKESKS